MTRRSRTSSSENQGVPPAVKWVIGAIVGGIASAATGFWLDRVSTRSQNAAAVEPAPKVAPHSGGQSPAGGTAITVPPEFLDRLRPPAGQQPAPIPSPPARGFTRHDPPPPAMPVGPFVKPRTPPAATDFDGLLAYWSLDEGDGARAVDSVGKTAGTLNGGKWVPGIRGRAVELNGSEFLGLGNSPKLNFPAQSPFTLACWVKPASNSGTVFWFRSHPDGLAILGVRIVDGKLRGWVRHDGGIFHPSSFGGEAASALPLRTGEWHHVALTRSANGQPELFQDGRSAGRGAGGRESTGKITTNARALGLDAHAALKNPRDREVEPLQGCLDEFCVFGRVLSPEEIAELAGRDP
jgi:hypothetical protein